MNNGEYVERLGEDEADGGQSAVLDGYDAFSAGIELGGLRNTAQIKILIGFLVKNLESPMDKNKLVDVLQIHGLANYFDASQAAQEMISSGSLSCDENGLLSITAKGRAAVSELENEIPRTVREKALNDALKLQTIERREHENKIEVERLPKGANVTFTVFNGGDVLMRLTVYAADDYQVERIRSNFLENPVGLYAGIVSSLFT